MINIQQVKEDFDNGVNISRATWARVLEVALAAQPKLVLAGVPQERHIITTFGQLKEGDVIVGPGINSEVRSVVNGVRPYGPLAVELKLQEVYGGAVLTRVYGNERRVIKVLDAPKERHVITTVDQLKAGDVIVGPGPNPAARSVVKNVTQVRGAVDITLQTVGSAELRYRSYLNERRIIKVLP